MTIDDLVRGSIDMHCHHTPNAVFECRYDALETAKYARQLGMRGLVLKNTYFPTAPPGEHGQPIGAGGKSLWQCLPG